MDLYGLARLADAADRERAIDELNTAWQDFKTHASPPTNSEQMAHSLVKRAATLQTTVPDSFYSLHPSLGAQPLCIAANSPEIKTTHEQSQLLQQHIAKLLLECTDATD
jgi:hypothetical protein